MLLRTAGIRALVIILFILVFLIAVLIVIFQILLFLLPVIIILFVLGYLFRALNKAKKGKKKDYLEAKYKVK